MMTVVNGTRTNAQPPRGPHHVFGQLVGPTAIALAQLYLLGLWAWLALYLFARDASALLFAVNSFAVYLFAPVPLVVVAAVAARRPWNWALGAQCVVAALAWAYFFGGLFVP